MPGRVYATELANYKKPCHMYSYNNHTEAISARLAPGLKGRIDFECQQFPGMNRNRFLNDAAEFLLQMRYEMRCGNLTVQQLPPCMRMYASLLK